MKTNLEILAQQGVVSRSMAESVSMRIKDLRKKAIQESFQDFGSSGHRLEYVATVRGVDYVDDAKAINLNSTWYALESMKRPVIWIAGGQGNETDWAAMKNLVSRKVRHLVCLGKDTRALQEAYGDLFPDLVEVGSMMAAVQAAYLMANEGDIVLLSPACSSFDLFESYQDKGLQFKKAVCEL